MPTKNNKKIDNKEKGRIDSAKPMLRNKKVGTIKINPIIARTSKKVFLLHDRWGQIVKYSNGTSPLASFLFGLIKNYSQLDDKYKFEVFNYDKLLILE